MAVSAPESIRLRGVRQNNLQGFDLDLPLGRYIVVTGLSGAGKSSLVFDTLHAEGQRRYVETFSAYTRQFLELLDKPRVDSIENIRPSIAIEQTNTVKTSRSTVGTMTELTDFFKVWFSHVAECFDPATGEKVEDDTPASIWDKTLLARPAETLLLAFKVARPANLSWAEILTSLKGQGYTRVLVPVVGGAPPPRKRPASGTKRQTDKDDQSGLQLCRIDDLLAALADPKAKNSAFGLRHLAFLHVIQDRLRIAGENRSRFLEACETALHFGHGEVFLFAPTEAPPSGNSAPKPRSQTPTSGLPTANSEPRTPNNEAFGVVGHFSRGLHSPATGRTFRPASPGMFSFNSPLGACPRCRGFGRIIDIDYRLAIPDHSLSIEQGAIKPWEGEVYGESKRDLLVFTRKKGIPTNVPFASLTPEHRQFIVEGEPGYGTGNIKWPKYWYGLKGFFRYFETKTYKMHVRVFLSRYRAYNSCPDCQGRRLQPEALCWKWRGRTLPELYQLPISELLPLIQSAAGGVPAPRGNGPVGGVPPTRNDPAGAASPPRDATPAFHQRDLAHDSIVTRLRYLQQVGLGYLTLDRTSRTLSGGEVERVNLTSCLGTSLVDTLFVLDEPSVGLHPRDIDRLIGIVRTLTDAGNTVVVVEHDEAMIRAADHVVEIGPEPGARGGRVVYSGPLPGLLASPVSITGRYLSGRETIAAPSLRRPVNGGPLDDACSLAGALATPRGEASSPPADPSSRLPIPAAATKAATTKASATADAPAGLTSASPAIRHSDFGLRHSSQLPWLRITNATKHNLRQLTLRLPLQRFVCLSGVSGSGKSTLLDNVIHQGLLAKRGQMTEDPASIESVDSDLDFNEVVLVDQSPLSKTPRSNPALYCEAWDLIRELYAATPAAQEAGFSASSFSFNSGEGRCDHCQGLGSERVEMQFLSDVFVPCPICEGRRFKPDVLAIRWNGRSVADLLATTVADAIAFFSDQVGGVPSPRGDARPDSATRKREPARDAQSPAASGSPPARDFSAALADIRARLAALDAVGLGYLPLGQPLNTLSGGESQRLKLVRYLGSQFVVPDSGADRDQPSAVRDPRSGVSQPGANSSRADPVGTGEAPAASPIIRHPSSIGNSGALLLLDEPTTGLHRHDVRRLLDVLQRIVDRGHSLIVIEHNLDVLKSADWLVEIGPDAGANGGRIVAEGTPEAVAALDTATSPFLRAALSDDTSPRDAALASSPLNYNSRSDAADVAPLLAAEDPAPYATPAAAIGNSSLVTGHTALDLPATAGHQPALPPFGPSVLTIIGARENNLRNISVRIPHRELTVVTGVSGSGKSTLAFDIVFAEGQRRFMESMSPYARQFVEQLPRPDIDRLTGIPPTVAIEQRVTRGTRKSTVATITEVAQYLRLLYARLGIQHHPETGRPVTPLSPAQLRDLLDKVLATPAARQAKHLYLCAPLIRGRKGHHEPIARWIGQQGYALMRADGRLLRVDTFQRLDRYKEHDIEVVVADLKAPEQGVEKSKGRGVDPINDLASQAASAGSSSSRLSAPRLSSVGSSTTRLSAPRQAASGSSTPRPSASIPRLLDTALRLGRGSCFLVTPAGNILSWFSTTRTDIETGESFPELDPKHFSFNSPKGWCPTCRGFGRVYDWMLKSDDDEEELSPEVADALRSIDPDDASAQGKLCPTCHGERLNRLARAVRLPLRGNLKSQISGPKSVARTASGSPPSALRSPSSVLRPPSSAISLPELVRLTPGELLATLRNLALDARGKLITRDIVAQIAERLAFLGHVGLDYLALDRPTETLSGGEAQRIRLAAQLGSNLSGVLYVLDEPSIGLHARDNERLIETLQELRAKGNTLLVVEHDDVVMERADRIIDLGPGAGVNGGRILANDTPAAIKRNADSLTGIFLAQGIVHPVRGAYREVTSDRGRVTRSAASRQSSPKGGPSSSELVTRHSSLVTPEFLELHAARHRNLRGFDLRLPLGRLIAVCGPSGAGKSTLFRDLLHPAVTCAIKQKKAKLTGRDFVKLAGFEAEDAGGVPSPRGHAPFDLLTRANAFRSVIEVDQSPIGKTPRSTPATYLGIFDLIRQFFASLPESKIRGYNASRFSFNTAGGRCETCAGAGRIKLEMAFMPDSYLPCDGCGGSRYGPDLADITWKGKSIGDVLRLSFDEAVGFFDFHARLKEVCQLMVDCGLGYLTLGQSSPTLSGGEAQRLKLVTELTHGLQSWQERSRGIAVRNLYLLEEPTIGLHLSDCEKLIKVLHNLVDHGHTVVVIEHHLDVLAEADWLIELGPGGGPHGGELLYQGPLAGLLKVKGSPTAPYLREKLGRPRRT